MDWTTTLLDAEIALEFKAKPGIEPDCYDDADGKGYLPLDRWGDRRYSLRQRSWADAS